MFEDAIGVTLSKEVIVDYGLRRGDEISEELLARIRDSQLYHDAYTAAARLVNYRMRTAAELERRLLEKKFPPEIGARVLEKFISLGLVDDSRFADAFVVSKIASKPLGKRELERRLREKGIDKELARKTVSAVATEESQLDLASGAAKTKLSSLRDADVKKRREKLVAFLLRRGFEWEIVRKVARNSFKDDSDDIDS